MARQTVEMSDEAKERLEKLRKHYELRMWEMLDLLILGAEVDNRRIAKEAARYIDQRRARQKSRRELIKKLEGVDPEKLDKLLK